MVIRQPSGCTECVALCLCDRVFFIRLGQMMPMLPAEITRVRWRLSEQPRDGGATLWGGIGCTQDFSSPIHCPYDGGHTYGTCHREKPEERSLSESTVWGTRHSHDRLLY